MSKGHRARHVSDIMVVTPGATPEERRSAKKAEEAEWASKSGPVEVRQKDDGSR